MKLWRSKKPTSCVSGKSNVNKKKNDEDHNKNSTVSIPMTPILGDRAMSPAQSEDSGLVPDRGTTYTTISLPRESIQALEIEFADRPDIIYPPIIGSVNATGPAADFLSPGDRIHQVDGISTIGLSDEHILSLLCHGNGPAIVQIEYSLPEYISQNNLSVTSKITQITVEREDGCLGLTLRGGGENPLIVTHVRLYGPVFKTGRVKPGDRLLRVDSFSLLNKTLNEAQQLLKCGHASGLTALTIEYDVSVMQNLDFSMGALLIEIERPLNEKLGLILSNFSPIPDMSNLDEISPASVYISSIIPASIADRCGALSVGDQIISVDENILEECGYTPEDAMALLDADSCRGYTQIQIIPVQSLRRRELSISSQKYGGYCSTLESRKSRQRRMNVRKSSGGTLPTGVGLCRAETVQVVLDCSQGSGLILGPESECGRGVVISQVVENSVADCCGCIQAGDRIIAVNKMNNLDATTMRQLLGDIGPRPMGFAGANWIELELEFDMSDSVIPASGVFNVKLLKTSGKSGLGITVNGSSHGAFVISEVKPGSPAHRTGSLRAGDILLAVDSHPLQHFNVDSLLKDNPNEFTTLTIKRDSIPDFLFDAQQRVLSSPIYGNFNNDGSVGCRSNSDRDIYAFASKYGDVKYNDFSGAASSVKSVTPQPEYFRDSEYDDNEGKTVYIRKPFPSAGNPPKIGRSFGAENTQSLETEISEGFCHDLSPTYDQDYAADRFLTLDSNCELPPPMEKNEYDTHQMVTSYQLEPKGGPLGITLAGSEDLNKPITISAINEGGIAAKMGQLKIGDCLLAINDVYVQGMALSQATKLLQKNLDDAIVLKILRSCSTTDSTFSANSNDNEGACGQTPQSQVLYTKFQPRQRSTSRSTTTSGNSSKSGKRRVILVTLFKDKVYDDYGFSLSDGLYEKGVFINRIRSGGPADKSGVLKPFDRLLKVNETNTEEFDCCLTVPLIATAGEKLDLVVHRSCRDE